MISVSSNNQVITLPIPGEIFLSVINDVVCPDRERHVQIPRAAHGSYLSPERFGNLHSKRTHATRRTINQDLLPRLNLSLIAETLQGGDCRKRYGRCFLECHTGRFQHQCIFTSTYILGKTAPTTPGYVSEYLIACLKQVCIPANRFNPPRYVSSEYLVPWS